MTNPNYVIKPERRLPLTATVMLCSVLSAPPINAQQSSFSGFTGVLTTPNALIAKTGEFNYQFNNLIESRFLVNHTEGTNHVFALGIYPRFEIGGRLTNFTPVGNETGVGGDFLGIRDLSGNAKVNLINYNNKAWLSAGVVDFGGLAQNFRAVYAVATGQWKRLQASAGVATGDNASFEGVFGNLHYNVNSYLSLLAELDTEGSVNAGFSASVPVGSKLRIGTTVSGGEDEVRAGINVSYALGASPRKVTSTQQTTEVKSKEPAPVSESENKTTNHILDELEKALANEGFTDTRVGSQDSKYYVVQVENTVFIHSDLEALDAAVKIARAHLPADARVEIRLLQRGLVKHTSVFSTNNNTTNGEVFIASTASSDKTKATTWNVSEHTRGRSLAHFTLQPELRTAIGTEFGTVDYSLGVRGSVTVPLWRGAHAIAAGIAPIADSDNFDEGIFANDAFTSSLERALLVQYFPIGNRTHTMLELGQVQIQNFFYTAARAQIAWQAPTRPLTLSASAAQYNLNDSSRQREVILGTASYSLPRFSANLSVTGGQFFFGDTGLILNATRRFGNIFVSAFVKVVDSDNTAGGLVFSAPFGPKRAYAWKGLTFAGVSRWSHGLQTTIEFPNADDNRLQPGLLLSPLNDTLIPRALLDSGRLNSFDIMHDQNQTN